MLLLAFKNKDAISLFLLSDSNVAPGDSIRYCIRVKLHDECKVSVGYVLSAPDRCRPLVVVTNKDGFIFFFTLLLSASETEEDTK